MKKDTFWLLITQLEKWSYCFHYKNKRIKMFYGQEDAKKSDFKAKNIQIL